MKDEIFATFAFIFLFIGFPSWVFFWSFKIVENIGSRIRYQQAMKTGTLCRPAPEWGHAAEICLRRDE